MRRVIANFCLSLDGRMEAPDRWHIPYLKDEMEASVGEESVTYEPAAAR